MDSQFTSFAAKQRKILWWNFAVKLRSHLFDDLWRELWWFRISLCLGAVNQTDSTTDATFDLFRREPLLKFWHLVVSNKFSSGLPLAHGGYITVTVNWTNNFTSVYLTSGKINNSNGNYNGSGVLLSGGEPQTMSLHIWYGHNFILLLWTEFIDHRPRIQKSKYC